MDRDGVRLLLERRGVRPDAFSCAFSLESAVAEQAYCLERSRGGWSVYYFDRGNRNDQRWFQTEEEALEAFRDWVLADPTTRRRDRWFRSAPSTDGQASNR